MALLIAAISAAAILLPAAAIALAGAALLTAFVVDLVAGRPRPQLELSAPHVLARGFPATFGLRVSLPPGLAVRVRQPSPPEIEIEPRESDGDLAAQIVGRRRGRHVLPPAAVRVEGPLGLARWYRRVGEPHELLVYPDMVTARRLATAVRSGLHREEARLARGALGLGTDFESVREYQPDDDIRRVNWLASARLDRPMTNQYRVDQDRDVICVVDGGRLMAAPLGDLTRLDAAIDATVCVALAADAIGDRCGALAFDRSIVRTVRPRRAGGTRVAHALFDLEPAAVESDFRLAFATVEAFKRALVFVFCDLVDVAASRPLVDAVPVIARRHEVIVVSTIDPDLRAALETEPADSFDVYRQVAALDLLGARSAAAARLRHAGAQVVEAAPGVLGAACVRAYLTAKARARV